ncbi:MAG: CDP-alcohol phosphatidyltransferase family protein [Dactylosporangium sp.]|nr:CDP-alcohol phosphatidyltransferase family protein [Dactylosporangium sp.]NNJ63584.1 CDP-alcohol phosphatidyltransferase family protein [Dactylosporangium sp.]
MAEPRVRVRQGPDTGGHPGWEAYLETWAGAHGRHDPSLLPPMVTGWLRVAYRLARAGRSLGLRPNTVTALGLGLSAGVVLCAVQGGGWLVLAAALVVASAMADTVDGALAQVTGTSSRLGRVYDAMADRLSEACWLAALAVLGAGAWLVAACGGLTWLHDYLRIKAGTAGTGAARITTVGERSVRTLVVALALLLAGLGGGIGPELPVGAVTAASAIWGLLQATALLQLFAAVQYELR